MPHGTGAVLATVALATGGTLLPFTLFTYGQSRVSAEIAGAFVNLEPLVGAMAGVALFGDPAGPLQAAGGAAIIAGIALSSLPLLAAGWLGDEAVSAVAGALPAERAGVFAEDKDNRGEPDVQLDGGVVRMRGQDGRLEAAPGGQGDDEGDDLERYADVHQADRVLQRSRRRQARRGGHGTRSRERLAHGSSR